MLALPNIGGALCSTPQRVSDTQPCGNAAKTRKPLTLAGMPDRSQPLVGRSSYCCLTRFFPMRRYCPAKLYDGASCVSSEPRAHPHPKFASKLNRLYLRHFYTDLLLVFAKISGCSRATNLATTGRAPVQCRNSNLNPHLTQCGQGRSLPARQPFGHSARTLQTDSGRATITTRKPC